MRSTRLVLGVLEVATLRLGQTTLSRILTASHFEPYGRLLYTHRQYSLQNRKKWHLVSIKTLRNIYR